jgi:hypothetical protein
MMIINYAAAQETTILKGKVIDADTKTVLSSAQVQSGISAVVTNNNGYFALSAEVGDSVLLSHIGYEDRWINFSAHDRDTLLIELKQSTTVLGQITISDIPTEDELKGKILQTEVVISREEENARQNLQDARTLYSMGYRPEMNALDNFKEFIKPPSGFIFFSSKGGGLIGAIKNLSNPTSTKIPSRKTFYKPMARLSFFRPVLVLDSMSSDTLAVKSVRDSIPD